MSASRNRSVRIAVVAAAGLVVVLAGMLVARLLRNTGTAAYALQAPPPATVPAPLPCDLAGLSIPCWSCPSAEKWPLRFVTDLDMLAPLGTGTANAAEWFAAFAKPNGPRLAEAEAAMARRVDRPPVGPVLPPGDPLLAEAAPWCDQASMRFYQGIFPLQGVDTQIPNLLFMLTLARSWIARGTDAVDSEAAIADFRRVVRLGRLLRQDDAVIIDDLVGLACIRIGAEAIYNRARIDGNTRLALVAAVVAGEAPPQKYLSAARITSVDVAPYLRKSGGGSYLLDVPEARFSAIREMATSCPDRRFRGEAALNLRYVAALASGPMRAEARAQLETLVSGRDPVVAANARWILAHPVTEKDLNRVFEGR
jgi:hypothetical protein